MKTALKTHNSNVTNAYDALAPFYESHWGTAFFDRAQALFENLLKRRIPMGSHVLDICCGSGDFAAWLSARGLQVSGLDNSRLMLDRAALKAPRSTFFKANMTAFRIPIEFDAATCFYNSINQVLTLNSLRRTLGSVCRHLRPGGWFLFDVVQEHGYKHYWDSDQVVSLDDRLCEVRYRYDKRRRRAICYVVIHEARGGRVKGRWVLVQRPFSIPLLVAELGRWGFRVEVVSPVRNGNPPHGRVAVLAQRNSKGKNDRHTRRPTVFEAVPRGGAIFAGASLCRSNHHHHSSSRDLIDGAFNHLDACSEDWVMAGCLQTP